MRLVDLPMTSLVAQILINGLVSALAYSLVAIGFSAIYRTTRIFHFAYGGTYAFAAYTFYTFFVLLNVPFIPAILLTLVTSAGIGVLTDILVYRPLMRQNSSLLVLLLSSLALNSIMINLLGMFYGNETKVLSTGLQPTYLFYGVVVSRIQLIIGGSSVAMLFLLSVVTFKTNVGRIVRAARDDVELLTSLGFNVSAVRFGVFAAATCLCALPALLIGLDVGITPYIGMKAVLKGAVAVIIGGPRIFEGPIIGAFVIGLLESLSALSISTQWADVATFAVLFIFLIFRPEGIYQLKGRAENLPA